MNILGMGPTEILLIVVLALIVFGPARLPEIMAQVGKAINDFRRATSQLSDEFNRTIQAELQETRSMVDDTRSAVTGAKASVASAISGAPAPTRTAAPAEPAPAGNGTGGAAPTNGSVPQESKPPLADTREWSWETAAPAPSTTAARPAAADMEATVPLAPVAEAKPTAEQALPEPAPGRSSEAAPARPKATAPKPPKELLPPY